MSHPIVFSPLALEGLVSIAEFINEKWGKKSSDKFKLQVFKTLKSLSSQPYIFKASTLATEIRKGIISKQTSFFIKYIRGILKYFSLWIIGKNRLLNKFHIY